MKKNLYIITLFLLLNACSSGDDKFPDGMLTDDKMVALMVDIEIAQAKVKFESASEGIKPNYAKAYEGVYKKHQLSKSEFFNNIEYYCSEPVKMKGIYDEVIVRLTQLQADLNKKQFNQNP